MPRTAKKKRKKPLSGAARKRKGTRLELKTQKVLEKRGYLVTKSGGSLGAADLVAIGHKEVLVVQVKAGKSALSKTEREELEAIAKKRRVVKVLHWKWIDFQKEPVIKLANNKGSWIAFSQDSLETGGKS